MSSDNRRRTERRPRHAGFTLVEIMVVLTLISLMSIALNQTVQSTLSADQQLETISRAALQGQRLTNKIANLAHASRRIYQADDVGAGYLAACKLSRFPPASDARLPVIDESDDLDRDNTDAAHTGNILMLVSETAGSPCVANKTSGKTWMIDTYRLVLVYPHRTNRSVMGGGALSRDVVIWQSEAFPSLQQIMEIPDEDERDSVIDDLKDRYDFQFAWDPRRDILNAFYPLKSDIHKEDPELDMEIEEDPALTLGPRLTIANVELAATDQERFTRRAILTAEELAGWQPHGLELKISGSSMSRKVWIHTVVEAIQPAARKTSVHACTTIVDARDY